MIHILKMTVTFLLLASTGLYAQKSTKNPVAKPVPLLPDSMVFGCFNPDDSIGSRVFNVLDAYEKFGHFGDAEDASKNVAFLNEFVSLFDESATLPDDLSDSIIKLPAISIAQYKVLGKQKGHQAYILVIERKDVTVARKKDESGNYYARVKIFKLFNSKAIIGAHQKHGAIYSVGLRINKNANEVKITDIVFTPEDEFFNFKLGNYARHIYSAILVSNKLNSLVIQVPQTNERKTIPSKSNFFIHAGYQQTAFLEPEAMRNNLNTNYAFSGTEQGRSIGIKFQKAMGIKERFGWFIGVEYELNDYDFVHTDARFLYTLDQNGNPLVDREGTPYDKKHVDVASYQETGTLSYLKPEIGMFLNMGGKVLNFQLLGSVGNAFKLSSTYQAQSTVSYLGEIIGKGDPISEDALGFYTDLQTNFGGDHKEVQNFLFYKAGAGLDIIMGKHFGLSLLFEYKGSFNDAITKNTSELMFLDPDTGAGFISQFNTLSDSRLYNALSFQAGIKFYLNRRL